MTSVAHVLHHPARAISASADRRIAVDADGLGFRVIVDDGIAYDEALWPFPELAVGCPVDQMTFRTPE